MKLSVLQENLAHGISTVSRAVAARSTLPILGNILLQADGSRLILSATNLEIGIVTTVPAQIHAPGAITLPAKAFADYVSAMPPDKLDLELNPKTQSVKLQCGPHTANLKGITADEFPHIPTLNGSADRAAMEPDVLKELIARAAFSAAKDESRPVLTNAQAAFHKAQMQIVTVDGFRLSVACAQLARAFTTNLTQLLPVSALLEVARLLKDQEEQVFLAFQDNETKVVFELADTTLVCNLQAGNFPDFQQIMPKTHTTRVVLNAVELANALRAEGVFARDAMQIVRLHLKPETEKRGASVELSSASAEVGDGTTVLPAEIDGDGMEIAFNAKFLREAAEACFTPQVALELTNPASPGIVKPVGRDDFTHVIMPMHVGSMNKPIR